jgi:hypothetical protein
MPISNQERRAATDPAKLDRHDSVTQVKTITISMPDDFQVHLEAPE